MSNTSPLMLTSGSTLAIGFDPFASNVKSTTFGEDLLGFNRLEKTEEKLVSAYTDPGTYLAARRAVIKNSIASSADDAKAVYDGLVEEGVPTSEATTMATQHLKGLFALKQVLIDKQYPIAKKIVDNSLQNAIDKGFNA